MARVARNAAVIVFVSAILWAAIVGNDGEWLRIVTRDGSLMGVKIACLAIAERCAGSSAECANIDAIIGTGSDFAEDAVFTPGTEEVLFCAIVGMANSARGVIVARNDACCDI